MIKETWTMTYEACESFGWTLLDGCDVFKRVPPLAARKRVSHTFLKSHFPSIHAV